ncbi:MAG: dephospho-CoA kinase [Nitrospinae bacterium]|nr:dephospho-CoA kinase [Nitrospinota bacterium]
MGAIKMKPLVIGLTGGVASGKSTVLKVMQKLGALAIDADVLARRAVDPGTPGLAEIKKRFGQKVFFNNGRLDRKKLAGLVFGDKKALADINAIIHPRVFEHEKKLIAEAGRKARRAVIVVDAPLMIESNSHVWKDAVVVMDCPVEAQIKRLVTIKGYSRREALARIGAQMPLDEKLRHADYVIKNRGSVAKLRKTAAEVFKKILADFQK